jgi:hypothetical protein
LRVARATSSSGSATNISSGHGRSFHRGADIHDDIQADCADAFGGGLVDHAELKPHGLDASRSFPAMAWSTTAPTR